MYWTMRLGFCSHTEVPKASDFFPPLTRISPRCLVFESNLPAYCIHWFIRSTDKTTSNKNTNEIFKRETTIMF